MNFTVTIIYMPDNARFNDYGKVLEFKKEVENCLSRKDAIIEVVSDFDTYDNIIISVNVTEK